MRKGLSAILVLVAVCQLGCGGQADHGVNGGADANANTDTDAISAGEARRLYTMKCSLCHGSDGRLGASKATDLSTSTMGLDERKAVIKYGKGLMPPQASLSASELQGLALYVEAFRN